MEKNDVLTVVCEGTGTNGEGIARADGVTLFIPELLKGERASVKVLKLKGNTGYGKVLEVLTPAEERARPLCPVFSRCGGCQLQHILYRGQLKFKTELVKEALRKIGGINASVSPCERSDKEYGYRNKLQLPIGCTREGNAVGFYAERSHRIVPTDTCPIHPEWADKVIAALNTFMSTCGLDGYDETRGTGQLRHIVVRQLKSKFIVTLVVREEIAGIDYLLHLLDGIFPEYSFYLNFNRENTNVIFGDEFRLLKGKGTYECTESGITFEAGPVTFVQVNENVRGKLYEKVVSLVNEGETVIDCYSGGGLLTAMLARKCGRAYGVEIVPEASACADRLKERNGLEGRMTNICGKVEEHLSSILAREKDAVVVLDPPRSGVERSVIKEIMACGVKKVIMISCNPATLARDIGILTGSLVETEGGELKKSENPHTMYEISLVQPFDMFPQTKHVETLVQLSHKK